MLKNLISSFRQWLISLRKFGSDCVDLFKPRNSVEILIKEAATGKIVRRIKGRNIVTSFAQGNYPSYKSGTDVMRRLLIDPNGTFAAHSLQKDNGNAKADGVYIKHMEVGVGNTPETVADKGLATPIGYNNVTGANYIGLNNYSSGSSRKDVGLDTAVLTSSYEDVTFTAIWGSGDLNGSELSEAVLITSGINLFARKTFTPFTKTQEFTFEIRWTIRF